jgi:hypothetical protein
VTPPTEAPTAQIPGEPPDLFPQDLLETWQRLQAMDARDKVGESVPDDADTQWQGEVSHLRSKLSALESPSPAQQPTNPPSETNSAPPQKDKGLKHD